MSGNAATASRLKSTRFRELISVYLQGKGLPVTAKALTWARPVSSALSDTAEVGDIQGLDGWLINAVSEYRMEPSGRLDEAQRDAQLDGKDRAAVIFHRSARGVDEHYVLLSLKDFAATLARENTP